jgi:hypothetical protein
MTKRSVLPVIAIGLLAQPALASEPRTARMTKEVPHCALQDSFSGNIIGLQLPSPPQPMPPHRPLTVRIVEVIECPIKPLVEYLQSPNSELRRLFDESENLRKVRDTFRLVRVSSTIRPF